MSPDLPALEAKSVRPDVTLATDGCRGHLAAALDHHGHAVSSVACRVKSLTYTRICLRDDAARALAAAVARGVGSRQIHARS